MKNVCFSTVRVEPTTLELMNERNKRRRGPSHKSSNHLCFRLVPPSAPPTPTQRRVRVWSGVSSHGLGYITIIVCSFHISKSKWTSFNICRFFFGGICEGLMSSISFVTAGHFNWFICVYLRLWMLFIKALIIVLVSTKCIFRTRSLTFRIDNYNNSFIFL